MKRLTCDNPKNNYSTALNLFYIKDRMTMVRGGGPAPDYPDVSLPEHMRRIIKAFDVDIQDCGDDDLDAIMTELLFDGPETMEGLLAVFYTTAWAFSALREQLKEYEDAEEQGRLVTLNTAPQDKYGGLKRKYIVFKSDTGEPVEGSFVLRPDRDAAARIALEAYAKATGNKDLADDIIRWIGNRGNVVLMRQPADALEKTDDGGGPG